MITSQRIWIYFKLKDIINRKIFLQLIIMNFNQNKIIRYRNLAIFMIQIYQIDANCVSYIKEQFLLGICHATIRESFFPAYMTKSIIVI